MRILGVPVGEVTAVVPSGNTVRLEMEYDAEYDVPADAQAVIVTPTLTADRFVQLTPAYTSGAKLEDGAEIAVEDTGTPIELDRIYRSLSDLSQALGPNGVNEDGTLDNVLTSGVEAARRARAPRRTAPSSTSPGRCRPSATAARSCSARCGRSTSSPARSPPTTPRCRGSWRDLGAVSQQLAGEREALTGALANLARVLAKVEAFVKDNRKLLAADVADLSQDPGDGGVGEGGARDDPRRRAQRDGQPRRWRSTPSRGRSVRGWGSRATSRTSTGCCARWCVPATCRSPTRPASSSRRCSSRCWPRPARRPARRGTAGLPVARHGDGAAARDLNGSAGGRHHEQPVASYRRQRWRWRWPRGPR